MHSYDVGAEPVPGYRLVRFLGRGGFGQVWQAEGPGGVEAALKIISLEGSQGLKEFRAIKPANLRTVGGAVQVCAYGLARALTDDVRKTASYGTPAYAAPERLTGNPSAWTDQYSLAISYYELRVGRLPFEEDQWLKAH